MGATHTCEWQFTLTKTQEYLRNRIIGNGCERDQIEAWRHFYRTNDPVVRLLITKSDPNLRVGDFVEEIWVEVIGGLNSLRSPQTYDSFLFWLTKLVRARAHERRTERVKNSQRATVSKNLVDADVHQYPETESAQPPHSEFNSEFAGLNDRLLHLRLVEEQPVERVARTLGLTCQQVIERQRGILKRIFAILIQLDIGPANRGHTCS